MQAAVKFLTDNSTLSVGVLAMIEGCLCAVLIRRVHVVKARLYRARSAAEDAARAAALAAPGSIDPEVVIQLLRSGQPATLDNVHAAMEQRERLSSAPRT